MQITKIEPQKQDPSRRSVYVDGAYSFSLDAESFLKSGLCVGMEIDEAAISELTLAAEYAGCKTYAFRLLARRSYAIGELRRKMAAKGFGEEACDRTVALLCELGYLDDEKYARMYVSDAVNLSRKGKRLIAYELSQKGIRREIVEEALSELDESSALEELVAKKVASEPELDRRAVNRIVSFCARKGYEYSDISEALRKYMGEYADE